VTLFNSRYRVESARNPDWNYQSQGYYFVTICTQNKIHYFGSVINRRMILSPVGNIAESELLKTPEIRDNVVIDEWVIMPNHIHVIFKILPGTTNRQTTDRQKNHFGPQSNNLAAIVRGFKSMVKKWTNIHGLEFNWQARYHDHIIRNEKELFRIRGYIMNNIKAWSKDSQY